MKKIWLWIIVVVLIFGLGFLLKIDLDKKEYNRFEDRGVPRINIELNGVELEEIDGGSKEIKYEGNELSVYNEGVIRRYGDVRIKGRGNGTWKQEKKPYQIKFSEKVDLLGMGKAKKWILLANAADGSNIRTELAFYLEGMLGVEFGFKGKFVELYVDEDYRGLYYLTHAVEIDKRSIDLKDPMGVLVELDNLYWEGEEYYETGNGDKLVLKDVKSEEMTKIAMEEFLTDYDGFEKAVRERNYEKVSELVDVESFAEYYLLNEFIVNPDAYWTSFYLYKDGADDKIHAGPGWDFDLGFGNKKWGNWLGEEFYAADATMIRKKELLTKDEYEERGLGEWFSSGEALSRIVFDLMEMLEFRDEVTRIFSERMFGRKEELIGKIRRVKNSIDLAIKANSVKWEQNDYIDETNRMIDWIRIRFDYFEKEYGGREGSNKEYLKSI